MIARIVIFTMLMLTCVSLPARPAQAELPWPNDAYLSGRNCGGTSLMGGAILLTTPGPAEVGGAGWSIGGAIDPVVGVGPQTRPSLAVNPAGAVFFAWQESRTGDDGDIFVADIAATNPGRRAVRVDDSGVAQADQISPAMAIDPSGLIHAVWQDQRGTIPALYYASSADNGKSWSANELVPPTTIDRFAPSDPFLISGAQGDLYLVWLASSATSVVRFSRYSGGQWSDSMTISSSSAGGRAMPRLALDSGGGVVAAWEDGRSGTPQIYTARLANPAGGSWGADSPASPLGASAVKPSLALGKGGVLYIAYQGSPGIYLIRSADSGASWSAPVRVDDGDGNAFTNPQLAVDSTGGVHCIWCRLRINVVADIVAARSTDGGASWGDDVLLASTTGTADPLALVADRRGNVYAAWTDDGAGANQLHSALWAGGNRLYLPLVND
jgi:hypothetical protein